MSDLLTMLEASCELIRLRKEVQKLKERIHVKDQRIAALEGKLRRATPRWPIDDLNANVKNN